MRYTSILDDGSLVVSCQIIKRSCPTSIIACSCVSRLTIFALQVCERSLSSKQGGPSMPLVQPFVRGEMLPSGFLIRPSDGGGSVIHIVDHFDLEVITIQQQMTNCFFI